MTPYPANHHPAVVTVRWLHAFTVIELLVVIAIISVLAALLLPTLEQAVEQGRRVVCASNQKQLSMGVVGYASDYRDCLPVRGGWWSNANTPYWDTLVSGFRSSESSGTWTEHGYLIRWAQQYAGADIYQHPWGWRFRDTANRGIFQCPSATPIMPNNNNFWLSTSYWMSFTPSTRQDWDPVRPTSAQLIPSHLTAAATPAAGFSKAFFFDALWTGAPFGPFGYDPQWNNHRPFIGEGQNVASGDGGVKWHAFDYLDTGGFGHPLTKVPKDYWAPIVWQAPRSDIYGGGFTLFDPTLNNLTGTPASYYFRGVSVGPSATQATWELYWRLVRLWR